MEVSGQLHAPATLTSGKEPLVSVGQKAGWATEPFWRRWWREKFPAPRRESNPRTLVVQPISQHYTNWAITALEQVMLGRQNEKSLKCYTIMNGTAFSVPKNVTTKALILWLLVQLYIRHFHVSLHEVDEKCVQNFSRKTWRHEITWGDTGIDGRIMLKWVGRCGLASNGSVAGSCEYSNEPSGSIKGGEFLE
jgi:hypothetical protein